MPYEIKKYSRGADGLAPPELKAVNPLGTAPVITDGTRNLAESGAIVGEFISRPYVTSAPPGSSLVVKFGSVPWGCG